MKVYFRREIQHNYLIIEPDSKVEEGYEVKMLMNNAIEGLLKFRVKRLDGEAQFFYDITSKQPLSRIWESREITAEEIRILISTLVAVLNRIEVFLLLPERILLQAEYIYVEPEALHFYFCLVPNREADFFKELQELLYFLLKKVKHQNQESVVLAYGLYQETQKENYGMGNLLQFLNTRTEKTEKRNITRNNLEENNTKRNAVESGKTERNRGLEENEENQEVNEKVPEKVTENARQNGLLYLCIFLWIGLLLGMGFLYWKRGWEFFWRWKEVVAGSFVIMIGLSLWVGYRGLQEDNGMNEIESKKQLSYLLDGQEEKSKKREDEEQELESGGRPKKVDQWQVFFEEEEKHYHEKQQEKKEMQTTLLSAGMLAEEKHYLVSLQDGYEDILLSYYPFLIGKAEYMTDYALVRDSVSRLHVKIERTEQGFQITDLNSTNGTWVGEHLLEANETFPLKENDKIRLADLTFWFK